MSAFSPDVRRLLLEARCEAPSEASRSRIFGAVLAQTAITAALVPGATQTGGGAALATKAALGVLFGAAVTVGLAAALLAARPPGTEAVGPDAPVATSERATAWAPSPPAALQSFVGASPRSEGKAAEPATVARVAPNGLALAHVAVPAEDPMEREARLVAEARASLLRGDPATAVAKVRAAQALPVRQMEPEELHVLAKALRALGDEKGALSAQSELTMRYPGESSP